MTPPSSSEGGGKVMWHFSRRVDLPCSWALSKQQQHHLITISNKAQKVSHSSLVSTEAGKFSLTHSGSKWTQSLKSVLVKPSTSWLCHRNGYSGWRNSVILSKQNTTHTISIEHMLWNNCHRCWKHRLRPWLEMVASPQNQSSYASYLIIHCSGTFSWVLSPLPRFTSNNLPIISSPS